MYFCGKRRDFQFFQDAFYFDGCKLFVGLHQRNGNDKAGKLVRGKNRFFIMVSRGSSANVACAKIP